MGSVNYTKKQFRWIGLFESAFPWHGIIFFCRSQMSTYKIFRTGGQFLKLVPSTTKQTTKTKKEKTVNQMLFKIWYPCTKLITISNQQNGSSR